MSGDGLLLTNPLVAYGVAWYNTLAKKNLVEIGFIARTAATSTRSIQIPGTGGDGGVRNVADEVLGRAIARPSAHVDAVDVASSASWPIGRTKPESAL